MATEQSDEREGADPALRAALTPDAIRAATRARLVARAAADARARGLTPPAPIVEAPRADRAGVMGSGSWTRQTVPLPVVGIVTLALAASVLIAINLTRQNSELQAQYATADSVQRRAVDSLRAVAAERDALLSSLTGPMVRVVGLSASTARNPRALMFWDQSTDRWTFIAHNLTPLAPGRTYQLWLVTDKAKISAGTFAVSPAGEAIVRATYALAHDALKAVAVTEEPAGGVPQPTGAIVIVGTAGGQ